MVLAVGPLVYRALEAAEKLQTRDNINLTVVNVRYIKPLDTELILDCVNRKKKLLNKKKRIITIEDGIRSVLAQTRPNAPPEPDTSRQLELMLAWET